MTTTIKTAYLNEGREREREGEGQRERNRVEKQKQGMSDEQNYCTVHTLAPLRDSTTITIITTTTTTSTTANNTKGGRKKTHTMTKSQVSKNATNMMMLVHEK